MIVRFNIELAEQDQYDYQVTYEGENLYADNGLSSIEACVNAALEGLGGEAVAAEVAYKGVISGTYALASLAVATNQIAEHAKQTTEAIEEAMNALDM